MTNAQWVYWRYKGEKAWKNSYVLWMDDKTVRFAYSDLGSPQSYIVVKFDEIEWRESEALK